MRTREFDKSEVLKASLEVFWKKGYFDTSIEDLTKATGVSRSGLYGEFESKRGLFLATIDLYEEIIVNQIMGRLEKSGEGLSGIEKAFIDVMQAAKNMGKLGCLICNTSSEAAPSDKGFEKRVSGFHQRIRSAFLAALKIAKKSGELSRSTDIEALADYLLGAFQGLAHAIRSPMTSDAIENFAKIALTALRK